MPTPTYKPLANITLSTSAASVTFGSIPSTYRDLVIAADVRSTRVDVLDAIKCVINSDTTSGNYYWVNMDGESGGVFSFNANSNNEWGIMSAANSSSNSYGLNYYNFLDYSVTDKHKSVLIRSNINSFRPYAYAARYASTSAITTIAFSGVNGNFASGSTFALYGIES